MSGEGKIRIGVVGGGFGASFHFHEHPLAEVVAVSDLLPDRRAHLQQRYQCDTAYESLEELLQDDRLDAVVTMRINSRFNRIPDDSDASILTAGLLGSKYVGIGAGGSDTYLAEGSEVQITQSAVVLEQLIGKFLFSKAEEAGTAASPAASE